jgi:hypothetical protein
MNAKEIKDDLDKGDTIWLIIPFLTKPFKETIDKVTHDYAYYMVNTRLIKNITQSSCEEKIKKVNDEACAELDRRKKECEEKIRQKENERDRKWIKEVEKLYQKNSKRRK